MGIYNIIQVSGSNTLPKASSVEDLKAELRDHVVKLNDALRRLSQLVQTSERSGGVRVYNVGSSGVSTPSGGGTSSSGSSLTDAELDERYYLRGTRTPAEAHVHIQEDVVNLAPDDEQFILAARMFGG